MKASRPCSGSDADIDALVGRAAESVYRMTQPYRYAIYLLRHENRPADAAPIFRELALHGSPDDKVWSYNMWAQAAEISQGDNDLGLKMYQQALAEGSTQPYINLLIDYIAFGRLEEALRTAKEAVPKVAWADERRETRTGHHRHGDRRLSRRLARKCRTSAQRRAGLSLGRADEPRDPGPDRRA